MYSGSSNIGTRFLLILVMSLLSFPQLTNATASSRVAVLDFSNQTDLLESEVDYITSLVRSSTRKTLPSSQYIIMTRENILEMLPPGQTLANCLGECAVETARNIDANFVVTGELVRFGGEFRITLTLHETRNGNLLSSVHVGAENILGLEVPIRAKTVELFSPLHRNLSEPITVIEGAIGGGQAVWTPGESSEVVVLFKSEPSGALIEVQDQIIGETPCSRPMSPGIYEVAVKKNRYLTHREVVEVSSEMDNDLNIVLAPDFGWLSVKSAPSGLPVIIDGEQMGKTPLLKREISCGPHEVVVQSEQYYREGRIVAIDRGEHEEVDISPTPIHGGIKVVAVDNEGNAVMGDVYVNGDRVGKTYAPLSVLVGSHEVEVRSDEGSWQSRTTILAEQTVEIEAVLAKPAPRKPPDSSKDYVVESSTRTPVTSRNTTNSPTSSTTRSYFGGVYCIVNTSLAGFTFPDTTTERKRIIQDGENLYGLGYGIEVAFHPAGLEERESSKRSSIMSESMSLTMPISIGMGYNRWGGNYVISDSLFGSQRIDYLRVYSLMEVNVSYEWFAYGVYFGGGIGWKVNTTGRLENEDFQIFERIALTETDLFLGFSASFGFRTTLRVDYYMSLTDMKTTVPGSYKCSNNGMSVMLVFKVL